MHESLVCQICHFIPLFISSNPAFWTNGTFLSTIYTFPAHLLIYSFLLSWFNLILAYYSVTSVFWWYLNNPSFITSLFNNTAVSLLLKRTTLRTWFFKRRCGNWTMCREWESLEDSVLNGISSSKTSLGAQRNMRRGRDRKAVLIRGDRWQKRSNTFQTQRNRCTCSFIETVVTCKRPAQVQARWVPTLRGKVDMASHP